MIVSLNDPALMPPTTANILSGGWRRGEGTRGVGRGVGWYGTPERGESEPEHEPEHELLLTGGTPSQRGPLEPIFQDPVTGRRKSLS